MAEIFRTLQKWGRAGIACTGHRGNLERSRPWVNLAITLSLDADSSGGGDHFPRAGSVERPTIASRLVPSADFSDNRVYR